jgi:hypothetical protein
LDLGLFMAAATGISWQSQTAPMASISSNGTSGAATVASIARPVLVGGLNVSPFQANIDGQRAAARAILDKTIVKGNENFYALEHFFLYPEFERCLLERDKRGYTILHTAAIRGAVPALKWAFSKEKLKPLFYTNFKEQREDISIVLEAVRHEQIGVVEWFWDHPSLDGAVFSVITTLDFQKAYDQNPKFVAWAVEDPELLELMHDLPSDFASKHGLPSYSAVAKFIASKNTAAAPPAVKAKYDANSIPPRCLVKK